MTTSALTNQFLDTLATRTGIRVQFYDPTGSRYGFPTFPYHYAPDGLATRRQLRADGLCPGGYDPVAQILWRHRKQTRTAYLYRRDLAAPKRIPSPAQLAAIGKALLARRTCRCCGITQPYYIPRRTGACLTCEPGGGR
jgi:putative component of membrane protein insertase Oxa1/YidC/SpoIIIJ protein YidD